MKKIFAAAALVVLVLLSITVISKTTAVKPTPAPKADKAVLTSVNNNFMPKNDIGNAD
ncbi:hypothetical protein MUY27_14500 [Mucilaginibacter sp. RS28]|uniref:Uncharacterized protein n=1 Tax=Mucilaginibacter straminoryzae TaxID=2932774 RepID=A0A9X1X6A6_9SPHI|nr:hypothetical protein [Mucilaginibacter straminoryzae]MCJ8210925.1 hypothetical protein [Mucilaginibacter straminoryzae]